MPAAGPAASKQPDRAQDEMRTVNLTVANRAQAETLLGALAARCGGSLDHSSFKGAASAEDEMILKVPADQVAQVEAGLKAIAMGSPAKEAPMGAGRSGETPSTRLDASKTAANAAPGAKVGEGSARAQAQVRWVFLRIKLVAPPPAAVGKAASPTMELQKSEEKK